MNMQTIQLHWRFTDLNKTQMPQGIQRFSCMQIVEIAFKTLWNFTTALATKFVLESTNEKKNRRKSMMLMVCVGIVSWRFMAWLWIETRTSKRERKKNHFLNVNSIHLKGMHTFTFAKGSIRLSYTKSIALYQFIYGKWFCELRK